MAFTTDSRMARTATPGVATTVLIAVSVHEFSVPVVRETPSLRPEPSSVAALW